MRESLSSLFAEEFNRLSSPEELTALRGKNKEWAIEYFKKALFSSFEVDELQKEIELILSKISHQNIGFLTKTLSLEELVLMLKLYLISWSAMKDVMAKFISNTLDLGIADIDLSFGSILRNEKVLKTRIPEICYKYNKVLDIGATDQARNEVAHRGKLLDEEVKSLKLVKGKIESSKYSLLLKDSEHISEEEYKGQMKEYYDQLKMLVDEKRKQFEEHFHNTIELNEALTLELASIFNNHLCEYRT